MLVFVAPAQSAILLSDTFNNVTESGSYSDDYGVNKELATRQAGSMIGTMTYTRYDGGSGWNGATQVYNSSFAVKALDLFSYGASASPYVVGTHDFARDVVISALLDPASPGFSDNTTWVAISARTTTATPGSMNLSTQTGVSLRVGATGSVWVLVDGATVFTGSVTSASNYQTSMTLNGSLLDVTINGTTLDLNGVTNGTSMTITGAAGTHNYIGLSSKSTASGSTGSTVDNLLIETLPVTLLPPTIAVLVDGTPVSNNQVLTIYGNNTVDVSAANSTGTIQSWSFTNGATTLSSTDAWSGNSYNLYGGTLTFTASNDTYSSSMRFTVIPEPATLALLGFGAVTALLRRKK
jgi:hypothetical protein